MSSRTTSETTRLTIGTVRTGLLRHSSAVSQDRAVQLLGLVPGEHVARSGRPLSYAVSPELLTGIDCALPSSTRSRVRGIGTVASRAVITGGRVVQASAYTTLVRAGHSQRRPWSYYLARPGVVEAIRKINFNDAADGFTAVEDEFRGIRTTILADQVMGLVQESSLLDGKRPFAAQRTTLHWTLESIESRDERKSGHLRFVIVNDVLRTLRIAATPESLGSVVDFCEELALHDWLLGTLLALIDRAGFGQGDWRRTSGGIRPAIDHLLHLWMPGARVSPELLPLRDGLDRRLGLTQQWKASTDRIRDQLSLGVLMNLLDPPGRQKPEA